MILFTLQRLGSGLNPRLESVLKQRAEVAEAKPEAAQVGIYMQNLLFKKLLVRIWIPDNETPNLVIRYQDNFYPEFHTHSE